MSGSSGIPTDALDVYEELRAQNTRAWWQANADRYAGSVREPLEGLLDALEDEFGAGRLYRPHRDVRFSSDTSPYKDRAGPACPARGPTVDAPRSRAGGAAIAAA